MSNITHLFELNTESVEHHLISKSPNLIITSKSAAGEENVFMASKWGEYNHVEDFETGKDKIKVPLDMIKEIKADTALTVGTPAQIQTTPDHDDSLYYTYGVLGYSYTEDNGDTYKQVPLLTLDGDPAPALAAVDIEIV